MKKNILLISLVLSGHALLSQTVTDFESFTLAPNSAYMPTVSLPFQTSSAIFDYQWDNSFGGYWSGGFAYTNKQDSVTGTFANLYGVRALKGYSNSATYVTGQGGGVIKLKLPYDKVEGFYITNTTYAWKVIKKGNSISRRFGDTTGTGSGTTIPQGSYPDYFKITAKGYKNGVMKNDSAVFYLADYRFSNNTQDYAVDTWQWFNTSTLGSVDSIKLFMYSSDNNSVGMNTPAFFGLDNFSASAPNPVGLNNGAEINQASLFPNPFTETISIRLSGNMPAQVKIISLNGETLLNQDKVINAKDIDTGFLAPGIYLLEIKQDDKIEVKKMIKRAD